MSEKQIITHCSPTLAGLKTGSIFNYTYTDEVDLINNLREINKRLVPKGLRAIALKQKSNIAMIYLYRPEKLTKDINNEIAKNLLTQRGYMCESPNLCVIKLARRIKESAEFPHEIGLFLGYPPEDVKGFIKNKAKNSKCIGYWKVYGDEIKAKKEFAKYKKCTNVYLKQWSEGKSVERLTVK